MPQHESTSFAMLGVPAAVVAVLTAQGVTSPFPIQAATLPDSLLGRDVLGRGRTGSGKTLAFVLPLVARLAASSSGRAGNRPSVRKPRGLILAPTRELATQIASVVEPLASSLGLVSTTIFGGVSQHHQVSALRGGVDIVVACPGRLEDLMGQKLISLDGIEITILDEADHMADLGFLPGVRRIMSATPAKGQRLLFSATLDSAVQKLVDQFMKSPVTHSVDSGKPAVSTMAHHVFQVRDPESKRAVVQQLASGQGSRLLFTRTKHQAKRLAQQLTKVGIPAVDMHGNLSQNARERHLAAFSSGEVKVLVATDIAARGLHVDDVELVVHVDPPAEFKAYLHRSGRTARAGAEGKVVTVILPDQRAEMKSLAQAAKITVTPRQVDANSREVLELVGDRAAYVEPPAPVAPQPARAGGSGRGRRGSSGGARSSAAGGSDAANGRAGAGRGSKRSGRSRARSQAVERPAGERPAGQSSARSAGGHGSQHSGAQSAPRSEGQGLVAMSRGGKGRRSR